MKNADNVYCRDCDYYYSHHIPFAGTDTECHHSSNHVRKNNWEGYFYYKDKPSKLNKHNNCVNFKKKKGSKPPRKS